jgi:hypothetical protein
MTDVTTWSEAVCLALSSQAALRRLWGRSIIGRRGLDHILRFRVSSCIAGSPRLAIWPSKADSTFHRVVGGGIEPGTAAKRYGSRQEQPSHASPSVCFMPDQTRDLAVFCSKFLVGTFTSTILAGIRSNKNELRPAPVRAAMQRNSIL